MRRNRSPLLLAPTHPSFVHSERFTVLFGTPGNYCRLFKVQFERHRHGLGFFVHLPYFAHNRGVLGTVTIPASEGEVKVDFRETSTTTTKRVKYVHHPDGRVQFSQDGKIVTEVVTQAVPLNQHESHLFTVNSWGIGDFATAKAKDQKPPTTDEATIMFAPDDPTLPPRDQVGRIVASRYTSPATGIGVAKQVAQVGKIQRPVIFTRWDGEDDIGIPIFPAYMQIDEFHINLRYIPIARSERDPESMLALFGGFHAPLGRNGPLRGLFISYAERDEAEWEKLVGERGTVDLASRRSRPESP